MDFVAVAIVSAIVLGYPVQQKSRILIGLNCILLCLNNSSQIAKRVVGKTGCELLTSPAQRRNCKDKHNKHSRTDIKQEALSSI